MVIHFYLNILFAQICKYIKRQSHNLNFKIISVNQIKWWCKNVLQATDIRSINVLARAKESELSFIHSIIIKKKYVQDRLPNWTTNIDLLNYNNMNVLFYIFYYNTSSISSGGLRETKWVRKQILFAQNAKWIRKFIVPNMKKQQFRLC